jgi:exonuclease SbcC
VKEARQYVEFYADAAVQAERLRGEERDRLHVIDRAEAENRRRREAYELALRTREQASVIVVDLRAAVAEKQERREAVSEMLKTLQSSRLRLVQTDDRAKEVAAEMKGKADGLNVARRMLSDAERDLAVAEDGLRRVALARKELAALDEEWSVLKTDEDAHALAQKMLHRDGLPTMILEATVPLVEARANELLERMPGDMMVSLVTQKQTKSGTWRDTLDIEVSEAGRERAYGMLSGAERFRVDLALRLGLSSVLLHRSGSKFETLWLDEPFAAQDRRALESLLASVAAVVEEFGLTLVVTHQQEVAERFPTRIEVVEQQFGVAGVEVVA